jgi:hypothetical protein
MSVTPNKPLTFYRHSPQEVSKYFGKASSSKAASELAKTSKSLYDEFKQAAVYRDGLLAEATLPAALRVKREDIQGHFRQEVAAIQNGLIKVPDELADRLSIPKNSAVTYDVLQKLMSQAAPVSK